MKEILKKAKKIVHWILATRFRRIMASLLIIIIIITPLSFLLFNKKTEAAWFDDNWYYRKSITVTNNTTAEPNVYVAVTLDTSDTTKFQTDCGDLRFTKYNGDLMPYYVASGCGTGSTSVYVAFDTFPAGQQTIYYYYGNPSAPNGFSSSQTGSVTQTNMKMSIVNGTAFADFSVAGTLTENLGKKLVITDSASKKLTGYIKAAGTGETLSTTDITPNNTAISDQQTELNSSTGWNTDGAPTLFEVISGGSQHVGSYGFHFITTGTSTQSKYAVGLTSTSGGLYKLSSDARVVSGWCQAMVSQFDWTDNVYSPQLSNSTYGTYSIYTTSKGSSLIVYLRSNTSAEFYFDNVILKQVLTPSATGVTITSTANGATFNWVSEEGSFNRNDSSNYTYIIYPQAFSTAASNYTVGSLGSEEKSLAPVSYWSFDEGYGGTAHDETSNKNDGTITGATWKPESECVSGKCLAFNGTSDYVSYANQIDINDGLTYSLWFKYSGTPNDNYPLISNKRTLLRIYDNTRIDWWPDFDISSTSIAVQLAENNWYHAVITQTGTTYSFFLNGKLISSGTANSIDNASGNKSIGLFGTNYFKGSIDEPKIYPYARTAAQIRQDYNAGLAGAGKAKEGSSVSIGGSSDKWMTDGLVGHWKMDETSGTTVADASGNSNTGTLTGAQETGTSNASGNSVTTMVDTDGTLSTTDDVYNGMILRFTAACGSITSGTERLISDYTGSSKTFVVATLASAPNSCAYEVRHQTGGKFGNGLKFDGDTTSSGANDDYVALPNNDSLKNITNAITISAWINVNNRYDTMGIFGKSGGSGNDQYQMRIQGVGNLAFDTEHGPNVSSDSHIEAGVWQFVTVSYDKSAGLVKLYINGNLDKSATGSGGLNSSDNIPVIGRISSLASYGWFFNGSIDEVRVYNRALSPGEVSDLYNWAPGPVGEWKMDEKVSGDAKTIRDSSGNGNDGTTYYGANASGMDCTKTGKFGSACSFDGTDDYVEAADNDILDFGTNDFTVSIWVKTPFGTIPQSGYWPGIFVKGFTTSAPAHTWGFDQKTMSNNIIAWQQSSDAGGTFDASLETISLSDGWHYITAKRSGTTVQLYVDGKFFSEDTSAGSNLTNSDTLRFGRNNGSYSGYFMNGIIDQARVYNYARTQKQILEDMSGGQKGTLDPIAYYKFDEGFSDAAHNSGFGGSTLNGTLEAGGSGGNATETAMWDNGGKVGKAIEFDGTNDYIEATDSPSLDPASLTISAWVKRNTGAGGTVVNKAYDTSSAKSYFLKIESDGGIFFEIDTTPGSYPYWSVPAGSVPDSAWHYIVVTFSPVNGNSSDTKAYIDGKEVTTSYSANGYAAGEVLTYSSMPLNIGRCNSYVTPSMYFSGQLDEVKIYNYALTADDVKADYNRGASTVLGSSGTNSSGAPDSSMSREYCVPGDATSCAGPVGEWKMDEKSGQIPYDTSGNGNDGVLGDYTSIQTIDPQWTSGKFGSALLFDATDDFVQINDNATFNYSGGVTVAAWVNANSFPTFADSDSGNVWSDIDSVSKNGILTKFSPTGLYKVRIGDASDYTEVTSTSAITRGQWYYMVVTHGGSTTRIYINGKLDKEQSVARTITDNNEHKFIGKRAWGNYIMDGKIDDVRVFNYARTPAQVAWDYNKGGPVAEWRFDECQGGTVHDESGNGNNGTINLGASGQTANGTCTANANTPWYNGRTGQKNASLNFDGTDDYVGLPTSLPGLNFGAGSFTFSTWIKAGSLTNQANIRPFEIAYCNASPSYITLSLNSNGAIGFGGYDSNGTYSSTYSASGAIDIGNWHHFTAVINRSTNSGQVYIDGKVSGGPDAFSWTGNLNCSTATDSASIGSYGAGGSGFNFQGSLDEFKIFNYALTEDQIKTLYNDGAINFH